MSSKNCNFLLECNIKIDEARTKALNAYLDGRGCEYIDMNIFISLMNYNKELELMNQTEDEANEYLDAFVALGG